MKKKAFTLVELVLAMTIFASMFTIIFSIYSHLLKTKASLDARSLVVTTTYDLVEKLNNTLQNYTIDYEEYFNRYMVGCVNDKNGITNFSWDIEGTGAGYCTKWTTYGNNAYDFKDTDPCTVDTFTQYWCSSENGSSDFIFNNDPKIVFPLKEPMGSCFANAFDAFLSSTDKNCDKYTFNFMQPYGTYAHQFLDVKQDVDDKPGRVGDDDDTDLGKGPVAIFDNTNIKELYLISKDKKTRIFIRNKLIQTGDVNGDGVINLPQESHYVLQMLQLKAFDAGSKHNFSDDVDTNPGVYDGVIDTWACDVGAGFICRGQSIGNSIYSGYHLPVDAEDGWVNLTNNDVSVLSWNMQIAPVKDPKLAWAEPVFQVNPFITLTLKTGIYGKTRWNKIGKENMNIITYDLQTSFNIKTNY